MRGRRILKAVRRSVFAVAAGLLLGLAPPLIAAPAGLTGQTLVDECRANAPDDFERGCRSVEQVTRGFAAECRRRGLDEATCESFDGRRISPARMAEYQTSGVNAALSLQRRLDAAMPLWEQQIVHTHNSFNSSSYDPTLTNQDPNQVYGLTDQLDMGVRFLELDLHWVPSPFGTVETNGHWVTLCHGNSGIIPGVHIGCTNDRPLDAGLDEIRIWLDAHPDEFVYIYFENQLNDDPLAHDTTVAVVDSYLPAPYVYRPAVGAPCDDMPLDASRTTMQATGARVLIVGNCGPGAWGGLVHERGPFWNEGGDPNDYDDADCAADSAARLGRTAFRRLYGDSTWLTAMTGESSEFPGGPAARMVACGVNIIGYDQLEPDDGKLAALVWSWSEGEALAPSGDCAVQGEDGRFAGRGCADALPFACVAPDLSWSVTVAAGAWADGPVACAAEFPGSTFGVPWNGLRNQLLLAERPGPTPGAVWLDYADAGTGWTPNASGD